MEHENDDDTNCYRRVMYKHLRTSIGTGGLWMKRCSKDHQTTKLLISVRIIRRVLETWGGLAVTQTPVENHQIMMVWKLPNEKNNDIIAENNGESNLSRITWNITKNERKRMVEMEIRKKNEGYSDYNTLKWLEYWESPGDLRRLPVTQTWVKNTQLWYEKFAILTF